MQGLCDRVLFDASHGTGTPFHEGSLREILDTGYSMKSMRTVGIGIAGGLDDVGVTEKLPALLHAYPDLSWDAEGTLHPIQPDGTRPLDLQRVRSYLAASARVCSM